MEFLYFLTPFSSFIWWNRGSVYFCWLNTYLWFLHGLQVWTNIGCTVLQESVNLYSESKHEIWSMCCASESLFILNTLSITDCDVLSKIKVSLPLVLWSPLQSFRATLIKINQVSVVQSLLMVDYLVVWKKFLYGFGLETHLMIG